jgi:carbon monoxide dehydrogenase subunit G
MLHFEGDRDFPQAPATVHAALSDARFLVACVPGVEKLERAEPGEAVCVLRPGFSFIRGTLVVTLRVVESAAASAVRIVGHGKGIGSSNDVEVAVTLAPHDAGCRVHWGADVTNLSGLVKAIPEGLLRAAAQKVIGEVWTKVDAKLAAPTG